MKKIYCTFVLLLVFSILKSQELIITELTISKAIVNIEEFIDNNLDEGPVVYFEGLITNNRDTPFVIIPSKSNFYVSFKYGDRTYNRDVVFYGFMQPQKNEELLIRSSMLFKENEELIINPMDSVYFGFDIPIFWNTKILKIFNYQHYDYSKELLQTLPTLKIVFKSPDFRLISKSICKVSLGMYYEYTPR